MKCKLERLKGIDVPNSINFIEQGDKLIIRMPKEAILDNMQENRSAFEAWALLGKSKGYSNVKLEIEENINYEKIEKRGHFNRFLYRVKCFNEIIKWFEISEKLNGYVKNFEEELEKNTLFYNVPNDVEVESKGLNSKGKPTESAIECEFANNVDLTNKILGIKVKKYYQQMPVGLFKEKISNNTRLFTGGKSAIDFWGISGNTLNIIELKVGNNKKLGVISEIFFYTCIMRDFHIKDNFAKPSNYKKVGRGFDKIKNIKKVNGIILTEEKHTRIDEVYNELRESLKNEKTISFEKDIKEYKYALKEKNKIKILKK